MITVSNLYARRGLFKLIDISFEVPNSYVLVVVGPNGSGKTTLLECIAGLHKTYSGRIMIDGVDVTNLPPEKRRVGYVPADYALFPNMTVQRNIWLAFKKSKNTSLDELRRILRMLQIEDLLDKNVEHLSSGQKQRVALARALAAKPSVLLMDEPCSALDPPTREVFRKGISKVFKNVFREFSIPVIYTTHDLLEARVVGDKIAVMDNGRIRKLGNVNEVFENPDSKFVAEFLGYNVLNGYIVSASNTHVSVDLGGVILNAESYGNMHEKLEEVIVIIKPQDIVLSPTKEISRENWKNCQCNILQGVVEDLRIEGSIIKVDVTVNNINLKTEISSEYLDNFSLKPGSRVFVQIKASKVRVLPKHMEV